MTKLSIAALAAIVVAGIAPAQAEGMKCDEGVKSFFERLQLNGSAMASSGDKLADVMRRTVRAYDACKAGDDISLRGLWDQIEKESSKS